MNRMAGYNLLELMVTLAIVALLAAIALPFYLQYSAQSANKACLAEAKGYTNAVMVALGEAASIPVPNTSACEWIVNASTFTNYSTPITAYPRSPGDTGTHCTLNFSTVCELRGSVPQTQP